MQMTAAAMWLNTVFAGFDQNVTATVHRLYELAGDFFSPFMEAVSFLGKDGIFLIILSLLLMLFKKTRRFGTAMAIGLAIGAVFTNLFLKIIIARPRPYADESGFYYPLWQLLGQHMESDKSFPSGHTTAAFASMVPLFALGNKKVSWLALVFAVLMGISRIYLVVHLGRSRRHHSGHFGRYSGRAYRQKASGKVVYKGYIQKERERRMFGFGRLKFKGVDKKRIGDQEHIDDYNAAQEIGRVRLGKLCLYYRDLGVKYYVPYEYIDRAFTRISECQPDDSPAYFYYRLILVHGEKEFANLIFNEEADVDRIHARLKEIRPEIKFGYVPPPDGKRRRFS